MGKFWGYPPTPLKTIVLKTIVPETDDSSIQFSPTPFLGVPVPNQEVRCHIYVFYGF
jgi:hypothetical protein